MRLTSISGQCQHRHLADCRGVV